MAASTKGSDSLETYHLSTRRLGSTKSTPRLDAQTWPTDSSHVRPREAINITWHPHKIAREVKQIRGNHDDDSYHCAGPQREIGKEETDIG